MVEVQLEDGTWADGMVLASAAPTLPPWAFPSQVTALIPICMRVRGLYASTRAERIYAGHSGAISAPNRIFSRCAAPRGAPIA